MSTFRVTVAVLFGLLAVVGCTPAAPGATRPAASAASHPPATLTATASSGTQAPTAASTGTPSATIAVPSTSEPSPSAEPSAGESTSPSGINGSWTGTYQSTKFDSSHGGFTVTFVQSGDTFSGTIQVAADCVSQGDVSGSLAGNQITFGAVKGTQNIAFSGTIDGDSMSGNYTSGPACGDDHGTWSATRD